MAATPRSDPRRGIWRRRVLAIAVLVGIGVVVWRVVDAVVGTDTHGARVEHLTIHSRAVGGDLPVTVVVPAGDSGDRRPLLVFLHGRGGTQDSELGDPFFSGVADAGKRAPVVAFPYGGDHSYWHDRADGDWVGYVVDEVIPQVSERFDGDPARVAIGGISMGGFGALDAAFHRPGRFCAVGAHSPAIWESGAETAAGAFDDAEDFARNDLVAAAQAGSPGLTTVPLWIDAGAQDPFQPGDQALVRALQADGAPITTKLSWPGGHDGDYWNAHWGQYLRFYGDALGACG
jgi:S-formylglutathione hydrolase FrmB